MSRSAKPFWGYAIVYGTIANVVATAAAIAARATFAGDGDYFIPVARQEDGQAWENDLRVS
jgi:hypothetical protein